MQPYNADYRLNIGYEFVSIETLAKIAATDGRLERMARCLSW